MLNFSFDFLGISATGQLLFNGMVAGMVFGLLALGIVLIYRSTRVINFAVGNMGIPASALLALLVINYGFPYWVALPLAVIVGTALGAVIELAIIRRLFRAPRVILLVATIGVAQLMQAIVAAYPDINSEGQPTYPVPSSTQWEDVAGLRVSGPQLTILIVVPIIAGAIGWLMTNTLFGKTVQATATNPDLSRTSGISPKLVSTAVWTIGGFIATLSSILLAGQTGTIVTFSALGPNTLSRALAAAVLAGMVSFRRALLAGIAIGITQSLVQFNFFNALGLFDFLLFLAVVVAVVIQARNDSERSLFSFAPRTRAIPESLASRWWVKRMPAMAMTVGFIVAALMPVLVDTPSRHIVYTTIVVYSIAALSVTPLTGWSGQLSLGQMAFAGIGAFSFAAYLRAGLPFVVASFAGTFTAAAAATIVGAGALRVKGLFLAVTTFTFGLAANQYLYKTDLLSDGNSSSVPVERGTLLGLSLDSTRSYYWFVLGILIVSFAGLARLRNSGIGRQIIAARDNPESASAFTVSPTRARLTAFALAGGVAGLAGATLAGLLQQVPLQARYFLPFESLRVVSMAVIGGLGTVVGPVLGALWVEGLRGFFPDNELVPLFTSSIGLLLLLLYFPGGLVQLLFAARDGLYSLLDKRLTVAEGTDTAVKSTSSGYTISRSEKRTSSSAADGSGPRLAVEGVTVRFGGNVAVDNVDLEVRPAETVGLIGTNGAGKSTLINAIGGFVPADGQVEVLGSDVTKWNSVQRARHGLGRTFQAATLFPELTVAETIQVALEARKRTGFLATALFLPQAAKEERAKQSEANELIDFLGLGPHARTYVSELSTGTRRIVELAGLLALDAEILCLDEPTAGVAQREAEAFGPLLARIRSDLDASILIIEHDMPMIMSVSDRVYCLEQGAVIASGSPTEVRHHPDVIASYLGTDDRAIERSNS